MMSTMQEDALLPAQFLSPDSIALSEAQVNQAIDLARHAATEAEQWQTYLTTLALLGLQEWLDKRSPELKLESDFLRAGLRAGLQADSLQHPVAAASLSQQVGTVRIAQSQIHLLTTDCLADPLVVAPRLGPAAHPDFYLLVEVLEELAEVRLRGYLSQAQCSALLEPGQPSGALQAPGLQAPELMLPVMAFADPSGLLLLLRAQLTAALMRQSSARALPKSSSVINLGLWLQNRLDQAAESLAWRLLPPSALNLSGALMGGPMRQMTGDLSDLNAVIRELQAQGVAIPASARAGECNLTLEATRLRLYLLTWAPAPDQWALLLILGPQPDSLLPVGLTLKVEADPDLRVEEQLTHHPYLYSLVVGAVQEQFRVTVILPTGAALSLPPFGFTSGEQPC